MVLEALKEQMTAQELSRKYAVHANHISTWKTEFSLMHLPFSQKSIYKSLDQVLIFFVELFHLFKLVEQFFIGELGGNHFVRASLH